MLKNYSIGNQARIVTALILTGILSVGSGLTFSKNATAASTNLLPETTNEVLKQNIKSNRLPRPVANAVVRDLARRLGIFTSQLKIVNYSQQTWRNGCLELPQPDELCTQALVPGWRVVVSNNRQNWIYHTNNNGLSLRLASGNTSSDNLPSQLPASVRNTVLQAASRRLQLPISRLTIIQAQQRTWSDGCLELGNINESCLFALTPGWRVVIGAAEQTLIYHTDETGSVIRLNEKDSENTANQLPQKVRDTVLQAASRRLQLPISRLTIIQAQQQTWRDGCLELGNINESCLFALTPGWRVVIGAAEQTLIYHTDETGSVIRLNEKDSENTANQLPQKVRDTVLQAASRRLQLPISRLTIIQAQQQTWRDGCLELGNINELCAPALTPGWRVVVGAVDQTLIYHSNQTGSVIRLNERNSENTNNQLPQKVRDTVLQKVSQVSGLPIRSLSIIESTRKTWQPFYYCPPTANCAAPPSPISGWQVVVEAGEDRWIYLTNESASVMQLSPQGLPIIGDAILRQASALTNLPTTALNIVGYKRTQFASGCDRSTLPNLCDPIRLSGWEVSVKPYNRQNPLVFLSNETGSRIQIASGNNSTIQAIPISTNELPPPLDRGMIFRQISSGGFAGRTYETVLLDDGTLIRVRIGDANDSERSVRRISTQEVQRFQRLLERYRFGEYQNLSYPPPNGAADYITYTITSREGTVRYNDISQNNLPQNLQVVVNSWNQIVSNAQR